MSDDFDWHNDPDIVQREVPAVAVYQSTTGRVVVRQERRWDEEYDPVILIDPRHAEDVAKAIMRHAGTIEPERQPKPAPRAAPDRPEPQIPGLIAAE